MLFKSLSYEAAYFISQKARPGHGQQLQLVVNFIVQSFYMAHLERFPADYLLQHLILCCRFLASLSS